MTYSLVPTWGPLHTHYACTSSSVSVRTWNALPLSNFTLFDSGASLLLQTSSLYYPEQGRCRQCKLRLVVFFFIFILILNFECHVFLIEPYSVRLR
jgi:hypothetical protein